MRTDGRTDGQAELWRNILGAFSSSALRACRPASIWLSNSGSCLKDSCDWEKINQLLQERTPSGLSAACCGRCSMCEGKSENKVSYFIATKQPQRPLYSLITHFAIFPHNNNKWIKRHLTRWSYLVTIKYGILFSDFPSYDFHLKCHAWLYLHITVGCPLKVVPRLCL
jgi:hypothetical protein